MSKPKSRQERQWRGQKNAQKPHGKVKSLDELENEAGK
ncbi:DUF6254 family protein [Oceanobacillus bengalensis]|nr:DUF6254 family protein [Oceanobacillus bengalensis]